MSAIHVDDQLRFHPIVTWSHDFHDGEDVIMPIDEILHYIVDRHFTEEETRNALHERIPENRRRNGDAGRIYRADLGEKATLATAGVLNASVMIIAACDIEPTSSAVDASAAVNSIFVFIRSGLSHEVKTSGTGRRLVFDQANSLLNETCLNG